MHILGSSALGHKIVWVLIKSSNIFKGAVGIAGFESGLWSVKGGNYQLCENSVDKSRAVHIKSAVKSVEYLPGDKTFFISSNGNLTKLVFMLNTTFNNIMKLLQ